MAKTVSPAPDAAMPDAAMAVDAALVAGQLPDAPLAMPAQILERGSVAHSGLLALLRMPFGLSRRPGH